MTTVLKLRLNLISRQVISLPSLAPQRTDGGLESCWMKREGPLEGPISPVICELSNRFTMASLLMIM